MAILTVLLTAGRSPLGAQAITDSLVVRALDLEGSGRPREAAPLYRRALGGTDAVTALLGLERVYAELGITDSLVAPLDSVVARFPADATVRTVQLRTYQVLRRSGDVVAAASAWSRAAPADVAPYRELARLLIAGQRIGAADSVLRVAVRALGPSPALAPELAQVRAAQGAWGEAAAAWRSALRTDHWLAESAAHSLEGAPDSARAGVRAAFMRDPVEAAARLALASLESRWGSPSRGWDALRDLPPDSATAAAWIAFAERAEAEGRWAHARAAFEAALRWRDHPSLRLRAATAALEAGDAADALRLGPMPPQADSTDVAETFVPLQVRALAQARRPADAARLAEAFDRFLTPGARGALLRAVAMGWVRAGDLPRAKATLAAAGHGADSSSAAGWIALFEGDATTARALLTAGEERSADVALALAILSRHRAPRSPIVGTAFLALLRGDSAAAASAFAAAADSAPGAASLLSLSAARLQVARGDSAAAARAWEDIATRHADTPEAPEALLLLGRLLAARGDRDGAAARLEQLVLRHPASALVPAARRELELLRSSPPAVR